MCFTGGLGKSECTRLHGREIRLSDLPKRWKVRAVLTAEHGMVVSRDGGIADSGERHEIFSPVEFLCASLATCVAKGLHQLMTRDAMPLTRLTVTAEAIKATTPPSRIERFDVVVDLPDAPPGKRNKLIVSAERACTVGNTLLRGATIEVADVTQKV